jgi:hypothetical protein
LLSDAEGKFQTKLAPGNYFLKLSAQNYLALPAPGMEAVPFTIVKDEEKHQAYELIPSAVTNSGMITGKIGEGSDGIAGVLVVAEDANGNAYSTVTDKDGNYTIFNVPAGTYGVTGFVANYNSGTTEVAVTSGQASEGVNVALTDGANGTLSGMVKNIATGNKDVDVSLVHPITKETIPGLVTQSVSGQYEISNIPDGHYIARATYKNDERVMDPDRIAKFGEPEVTFSGGSSSELTFDITGSITLSSPTNAAASVVPVEVTSTTPVFSWNAYSSTSDYVIEVTDATTGVVVWGGFDKSGELPQKNIVIESVTSVTFNYDGTASIAGLVPGRIYRWRIFASKDDQNSTTGWTLISASEEQMGLIRIVE